MKQTLFIITVISQTCFGWGELGHQITGRVASRLVAEHPKIKELIAEGGDKGKAAAGFASVFKSRGLQQAHVANIPDIYWRNLEGAMETVGKKLGDAAHFINPERIFTSFTANDLFKIPLQYEVARATYEKAQPGLDFFEEFGTAPWRAQQFQDLMKKELAQYPKKTCEEVGKIEDHPTRRVLTFAGLLSHFTSDTAQPYHVSQDYDGVATNQKGIHSYFETEVVNELNDASLERQVYNKARKLEAKSLWDVARKEFNPVTPETEIVAVMFALAHDSFSKKVEVSELDKKYAIATFAEAQTIDSCRNFKVMLKMREAYDKLTDPKEKAEFLKKKVMGEGAAPPCRRRTFVRVGSDGNLDPRGRTVAQWHQTIVRDRIAVASVLTADLWVKAFVEGSSPNLCWTWKYALKPGFVSPKDENCGGYASDHRSDGKDAVCPLY